MDGNREKLQKAAAANAEKAKQAMEAAAGPLREELMTLTASFEAAMKAQQEEWAKLLNGGNIQKSIAARMAEVQNEIDATLGAKIRAASKEWEARILSSGKLQQAIKQIKELAPYMDAAFAAYQDDPLFLKHDMRIMLLPIRAYIEHKGLEGADEATAEAQREPFLDFFKAFMEECRAIYEADPAALDGDGVHRAVMQTLTRKGMVQGDAAYQQASEEAPIAEAITALTIVGYSFLKQGPITNSLAKINTKARGSVDKNPITGAATVKNGDLSVLIEHFDELTRGLDTSTQQLLDILISQFTRSGGQCPLIQIPLKEYMEKRGLKDEKEARKQVNEDLETLRNIKLTFNDRKGGYVDTYLFGGEKGIKNSIIFFSLSRTFYETLKSYPLMPVHDALYRTNTRYFRHAYYLGRTLFTHKRMNAGKGNENRIAVKTLLKACPLLPTYESLDKSKGEISRKIIEPFQQNLNHLEDLGVLTWSYCHKGGEPMTAEEESRAEKGMPYDLFSDLLIQFDIKDYPDQAALLSSRTKRKKQREKTERRVRAQRKTTATSM